MDSNSELCAIMDSTSPSDMWGLRRELNVTMLCCLEGEGEGRCKGVNGHRGDGHQ
jgi:hypothetical protein